MAVKNARELALLPYRDRRGGHHSPPAFLRPTQCNSTRRLLRAGWTNATVHQPGSRAEVCWGLIDGVIGMRRSRSYPRPVGDITVR